MFYGIIWSLAGAYMVYLAFEVLILKKVDKIRNYHNKNVKNIEGYRKRYGLILLSYGLVLLVLGILIIIFKNPTIFSFTLMEVDYEIHSSYLIVLIAILYIVSIALNEKLSKKDE